MAAPRLFEAGAFEAAHACLKLRHLKLSGLKLARVFEAAAFDVAEDVCKFETDFNIVRR